MAKDIIDEKTKSFLIACLVTGIDVESKPDIFMAELVEHMNSIERVYWAQGDQDGIILHNKYDEPIVNIMYSGERMTFKSFDFDEFTAYENQKEIGFALLNIIGYIQSKGLNFRHSILGSEAHTVNFEIDKKESDDKISDWAL